MLNIPACSCSFLLLEFLLHVSTKNKCVWDLHGHNNNCHYTLTGESFNAIFCTNHSCIGVVISLETSKYGLSNGRQLEFATTKKKIARRCDTCDIAGLSACDGSLGNIMNNYTGAVLGWWCCSSSQWAGIILCLGGANGRLRYINNMDSRCPDPCREWFLKYCYIIVHKTELEFWFKWFREFITWLVTAH